jgi:ElaB/YqjD/DUF883 family membrane-anchored ribosome-binding protein
LKQASGAQALAAPRFEEAAMNRAHRDTPAERLRGQAATVGKDLRELGHVTEDVVRETAANYIEEGRQRAADVGRRVNDYVTERPVKALMLAAGAGILLGYLFSRRH